jgi:hypothetical protein
MQRAKIILRGLRDIDVVCASIVVISSGTEDDYFSFGITYKLTDMCIANYQRSTLRCSALN